MNRNQTKSNIFRLATIIVVAVFLLSFSGCQKDSQQTSDVPDWVKEFFHEDPELKWAYENGYFLEEPITEEIDGTRFAIWVILSDDVLTQLLISAESIEGDDCEINGRITALDGEPIEYGAKRGGSYDYGRVLASVQYIFTPAPGDHVFTVEFKDRESGSIVLEKEVEFTSAELATLNTTHQIDQTIETDGGSLKIDKVVYTPSMIYVGVLPSGAERLYDKDFYIQADNKELNGEMRQNGLLYPDDPYYMAFPRPKKADEVELVIPFLAYNKEANMTFSKSDVGQTKSLEETDLTLQDWRVTDEGLELEISYSDTGHLEEIIEWTLPDSDIKSIDFYPFDFRERTTEPKVINYQFNPIFHSDEWLTANAVTITMVKVSQEGPWTVELPGIEEYELDQTQELQGETTYTTMKEAADAVLAQTNEDLYFEGGTYSYETQAAYDSEIPTYIILFAVGEVEDNQVDSVIYTIGSTITKSEGQMLITTPEAHESIKNSSDERLNAYTDMTHTVVDLAKAEGRDLADDAFSMGYTLDGLYSGEWFYVFFNTENLQAAYNTQTEELVVSEDMTSLSITDGVPSQTP